MFHSSPAVPRWSSGRGNPLDHLTGAGLVWRISGGKIAEMHTDWAAIEVNGERHVFHRRPAPVSFVMPWTLPCVPGGREP